MITMQTFRQDSGSAGDGGGSGNGGSGDGGSGNGGSGNGGSSDVVAQTAGLTVGDWITAGVIVGVAIAVAMATSYGVRSLVSRRNEMIAILIGRVAGTVVFLIGFVYGLNSIGVAVAPLLGSLGIGGLALAFALRSILQNVLAGVLIQIRQPFQIGDLVKLDGYFGRIESISLRTVDMETVDGEYVMIPAATVVDNAIENWNTTGKRREDIVIGIDYDADLETAIDGLAAAIRDLDVILDREVKVVVEEFGGSSVNLRILAWHDVEDHFLDVITQMSIAAKTWCHENGVGIPFPIREIAFRQDDQLARLAGEARPEPTASGA